MSEQTEMETSVVAAKGPPIHSFHHPAIKCFDAEETRRFYEDILGLPLNAAVVINDDGRGGDYYFMHIFFRMADGDFLAFFDKDCEVKPDLFKPFGENDLRLGLRVENDDQLNAIAGRLEAAGVPYAGPKENGFVSSIFFQDPNHVNLEVSAPVKNYDDLFAAEKAKARDVLAKWTEATAQRKAPFRAARTARQ